MYYIYIIQSQVDKGYYVGYTSNLDKRISEHNRGKTKSLRHRLPVYLIYFEEYQFKKNAKSREKQIKSYKGGQAFLKLIGSPRKLRG